MLIVSIFSLLVLLFSRMSNAKTFYKQAKRKAGLDKPNRLSKLVNPDTKSRTLFYSTQGGSGTTSTMGR